MISSIQSSPSCNSFKAKVHMDLRVQDACNSSAELRAFVKFLKDSSVCKDLYLSTKPQPGIISAYESYLMGQSVHENGKIYDTVLGSLLRNPEGNDCKFRQILNSRNVKHNNSPEKYYNNLLYYMA